MPVISTSMIEAQLSYRRQFGDGEIANVKVPSDVRMGGTRFKKKGGGEILLPPSTQIEFPFPKDFEAEEFFSRFMRGDTSPKVLNTPAGLIFEVNRCWNALRFWEMTPGKKFSTKEEVLRASFFFGPQYAEKISDMWDYGIRLKFSCAGFREKYAEWEEVDHYNFIPPVSCLIHWKESCNDIEYMKIPLRDMDNDLVSEFRDTLEDIIDTSLDFPNDEEVFAVVKTSTSYSPYDGKTRPFHRSRLEPEANSYSRTFKAKRSVIRIAPCNVRDTVVTSIDTYNSIKRCDLIISRVLDGLPESLIHSSPGESSRRLERAARLDFDSVYWLRDIKKCGLTYPRKLFLIIRDSLKEYFPEENFDCFDIFEHFSVRDEEERTIPDTVRGFGLGMANNLVTLCQCITYRMLMRRIPDCIDIDGYFGNDDSILHVKPREGAERLDTEDLMAIQIEDFSILQGLDIITNDKKSFWSRFPIIFEKYGHHGFKEKGSRIAVALSSALLAPDIKYAKLLVSTLSQSFWTDAAWIKPCLDEIVDQFGFEYFPEEVEYDYLLGGWISKVTNFCSSALIDAYALPDHLIERVSQSVIDKRALRASIIKTFDSGQITQNYSVAGKRAAISWVSEDIEEKDRSFARRLYMDEKEFTRFYDLIYHLSRSPYEFLRRREKVYYSERKKYTRVTEKDALILQILTLEERDFSLPDELVVSQTYLFDIDMTSSAELTPFIRRNAVSRYLQCLKDDKKIISEKDFYFTGSRDYLLSEKFKDPSSWSTPTGKIRRKGIDAFPEGIHQFCRNPWIVLWDYYQRNNTYPEAILRIAADRDHFKGSFLNKEPKSEVEAVLLFQISEEDEDYEELTKALKILSEVRKDIYLEEHPKPMLFEKDLCEDHLEGRPRWDPSFDIYNVASQDCPLCIKEHQIWAMRFASDTDHNPEYRLAMRQALPKARDALRELISSHYPLLEPHMDLCLQVRNDWFDEQDASDYGDTGLLGMFDT